jgi:hypothetical protein
MQVWLAQDAPPSTLLLPPSTLLLPPSTPVHASPPLQVVPSAWLLQAVALAGSQISHEFAGLVAPAA